MFVRFINREASVSDLLGSFSQSTDSLTAQTARKALMNPPDLEEFRKELEEAVRDLIDRGLNEELKSFVNHYMEGSLIEDIDVKNVREGQNRSQVARIADPDSTWIQGLICYNLSLYIKAYGLEDLKSCKECSRVFAHKGKWAAYCSDTCKNLGKNKKKDDGKDSET